MHHYAGITLEEHQKVDVKKDYKILFRLVRYVGPYKMGVVIAVGLLLIISGLELAAPYITKIAIDEAIIQFDRHKLALLMALYLGTILTLGICNYIQKYMVNHIGQRIMHDLAMDLFTHLQRLSLSFYNKHPVGRIVTRLTNDIQSLQELFTSGVVAVFSDVFILAAIIGMMLFLNVKLTLVTLIGMPIILVISTFFRRAIRKTYDQIRIKIARLNAFLNENITGIKVVQLFNAQKESMEEFSGLSRDYMKLWLKTVGYISLFFPFISLMGGVMTALVIWYGGSQVIRDALTFGSLVAFLQYVQRLIHPLHRLSERYNVFLAAIASARKVFDMMDSQEMIPEPETPLPIHQLKHTVEFRNVSFSYHPSEPILKNVSFTIGKNEKVAIVGATGAGKTTIINLLYRFYDVDEGEILIDGRNIKEYDIKELRRNFGLVQQDVFLFSGTILENVRLGDPSIGYEEVQNASKLVKAHELIERLPEKYNTVLGERGTGLSTGEKQLLAFARTVAMNPRIMLVLDEATSNIDSETERLIQEGMMNMLKDRTALIIAHRLSTIRQATRIIVLHKGEIREIGTHDELIQHKGVYYNLYQMQFALLKAE